MRHDIRKEIEKLDHHHIILFIVNESAYMQTNVEILRILCMEKKLVGIYVTINRPYESIVEFLQKNAIDVSRLYFIDATTKQAGGTPQRTEHCLYLNSPKSLTDLSLILSQAVPTITGEKFIFLDSLTTLLLYNETGTVSKFAHFLTTKMRIWNVKGVLISLEKGTSDELIAHLTQFCDEVITIGAEA